MDDGVLYGVFDGGLGWLPVLPQVFGDQVLSGHQHELLGSPSVNDLRTDVDPSSQVFRLAMVIREMVVKSFRLRVRLPLRTNRAPETSVLTFELVVLSSVLHVGLLVALDLVGELKSLPALSAVFFQFFILSAGSGFNLGVLVTDVVCSKDAAAGRSWCGLGQLLSGVPVPLFHQK